ncbi:MAG TPA: hypothetical protein VK553_02380 [Candidatus Nitrosopolaris rasttigaisensis]|nr:hypothetical protein [Candidatus Nitrosopolaris rasttigaisensis]
MSVWAELKLYLTLDNLVRFRRRGTLEVARMLLIFTMYADLSSHVVDSKGPLLTLNIASLNIVEISLMLFLINIASQ